MQIKFILGNEAVVEGALSAGCTFFSGYPITPSSEIAEAMSRELPLRDGVFLQMEDEIGAMGVIVGASLTGRKVLTATSGPGFSLKQEILGYASFTEIPCVVVNVQRGGPSTGLPTMASQSDFQQARWGTHGDHPIIVLSPSSVQECFDYTVKAFNLSEKYRTPVIFLMDEVVGHLREKVSIYDSSEIEVEDRAKPTVPPEQYHVYGDGKELVPPLASFGSGYRFHMTGLAHNTLGLPASDPGNVVGFITRIHEKIEKNLDDIIIHKEFFMDDSEIVLVTFGSTTRSAISAAELLREKHSIKAGVLQLVTVWPYPYHLIEKLNNKKKIVVPEMNLGQMRGEVEKVITDKKILGVNRIDGNMITPDEIIEKILKG
ncbi:MAG TPA: 2-oxoacid:acceptor oxidoreductase subunit alpha [Firmicutes bacterium]|nr:2-oxoacid:acceptor oxidoreductase subunit alpha [Bacillota bacterium]